MFVMRNKRFYFPEGEGGASGDDGGADDSETGDSGSTGDDDGSGEDVESKYQAELEKLRKEKADIEKARRIAEEALKKEKSAKAKVQRDSLSVEEQLAERLKEFEDEKKQFDLMKSKTIAIQILAGAEIGKEYYEDIIDDMIDPDEHKTRMLFERIAEIKIKTEEAAIKKATLDRHKNSGKADGVASQTKPTAKDKAYFEKELQKLKEKGAPNREKIALKEEARRAGVILI